MARTRIILACLCYLCWDMATSSDIFLITQDALKLPHVTSNKFCGWSFGVFVSNQETIELGELPGARWRVCRAKTGG